MNKNYAIPIRNKYPKGKTNQTDGLKPFCKGLELLTREAGTIWVVT